MTEAETEHTKEFDRRLYRAVTAERAVEALRAELTDAQRTANANYDWADWLAGQIAAATGTDLGVLEGSDRWRCAGRSLRGRHRQGDPQRPWWGRLRRKPSVL